MSPCAWLELGGPVLPPPPQLVWQVAVAHERSSQEGLLLVEMLRASLSLELLHLQLELGRLLTPKLDGT